jgi:hypothetical protein
LATSPLCIRKGNAIRIAFTATRLMAQNCKHSENRKLNSK